MNDVLKNKISKENVYLAAKWFIGTVSNKELIASI